MTVYLELLRDRRIATLLGAALIARLPFGINALALVLLVLTLPWQGSGARVKS